MSRKVAPLTHPGPAGLPAPSGLSPRSQAIWSELVAAHDFADFELVTFTRALEWFDQADAKAAQAADAKDPAESARLLKVSMDAATTALRFWRTLKFPPPVGVRRPGRPSGPDWSASRKAAS